MQVTGCSLAQPTGTFKYVLIMSVCLVCCAVRLALLALTTVLIVISPPHLPLPPLFLSLQPEQHALIAEFMKKRKEEFDGGDIPYYPVGNPQRRLRAGQEQGQEQ